MQYWAILCSAWQILAWVNLVRLDAGALIIIPGLMYVAIAIWLMFEGASKLDVEFGKDQSQ